MPQKTPHPYALLAFNTLESHFNSTKPLSLTQLGLSSPPPPASPLFVTWNKVKHGTKHLRGCIGTFSALPLERGIREYATIAAFQDTRFSPIKQAELPTLATSVTVLMNFEEAEGGALDWELGKHGIRVKIVRAGRSYGATFLPEVATEQGWDKEETIEHCVRKAGFRGEYQLEEVKVTRYEGVKFECTYEQYEAFMESL